MRHQPPEGRIGDARHGSEHDPIGEDDRADGWGFQGLYHRNGVLAYVLGGKAIA